MILPKWLFEEVRKNEHEKGFDEGYRKAKIDLLCKIEAVSPLDKNQMGKFCDFQDWLRKIIAK